jgi:hypothetical protein
MTRIITMRVIIAALATILLLIAPVEAAEPTGAITTPFAGLSVEVSGGSSVAKSAVTANVSRYAIGAGYDYRLNDSRVVLGGVFRLETGDNIQTALAGFKAGYAISSHAMLYGLSTIAWDLDRPNLKNAVLSLGAGAEVMILDNASVFGEATRNVAEFGSARGTDITTYRAGVRYRF